MANPKKSAKSTITADSKAVATVETPKIELPVKSDGTLDKTKISTTIKQLEELRDQLKGNLDQSVKTDICFNIQLTTKNIQQIDTLTDLVYLHAAAREAKMKFDQSVSELGLTGVIKPFNINGVSIEEFNAAIVKRTFEIKNKASLEQVENSLKEMQQFLSEEEKQKRAMERIIKSASGLLQ